MTDRITSEGLDHLFDVPFTFSKNCASGLLPRCECWRCRGERGEPATEETEALAEQQSSAARKEMHESTMRILGRRP